MYTFEILLRFLCEYIHIFIATTENYYLVNAIRFEYTTTGYFGPIYLNCYFLYQQNK